MLSNAYFDLIARNTLAALVHSKSRLTDFQFLRKGLLALCTTQSADFRSDSDRVHKI